MGGSKSSQKFSHREGNAGASSAARDGLPRLQPKGRTPREKGLRAPPAPDSVPSAPGSGALARCRVPSGPVPGDLPPAELAPRCGRAAGPRWDRGAGKSPRLRDSWGLRPVGPKAGGHRDSDREPRAARVPHLDATHLDTTHLDRRQLHSPAGRVLALVLLPVRPTSRPVGRPHPGPGSCRSAAAATPCGAGRVGAQEPAGRARSRLGEPLPVLAASQAPPPPPPRAGWREAVLGRRLWADSEVTVPGGEPPLPCARLLGCGSSLTRGSQELTSPTRGPQKVPLVRSTQPVCSQAGEQYLHLCGQGSGRLRDGPCICVRAHPHPSPPHMLSAAWGPRWTARKRSFLLQPRPEPLTHWNVENSGKEHQVYESLRSPGLLPRGRPRWPQGGRQGPGQKAPNWDST